MSFLAELWHRLVALPLVAQVLGVLVLALAAFKGDVLKAGLRWCWFAFRHNRPKLTIELRETWFYKRLASLDVDFDGYTLNVFMFFRVWIVNESETPTTVKAWKLIVKIGGKKFEAENIADISKWQLQTKKKESDQGRLVIRDIREKLTAFSSAPLQHGIPLEGWIGFLVHDTKEAGINEATVYLTLVDSFGKPHHLKRSGPWECESESANPEVQKMVELQTPTTTVMGLTEDLHVGSRVNVLMPQPGKTRDEWPYSSDLYVIREVDKEKNTATASSVLPPLTGPTPTVTGPMSGPLSPFRKTSVPG